jgi:hypothetical protein
MEVKRRDGVTRIADERRRQMGAEGYGEEHDDCHDQGELALAACAYAAPEPLYACGSERGYFRFYDPWPWGEEDDKRPRTEDDELLLNPKETLTSTRIRLLEKAGALIAAEIDRLLRKQESASGRKAG